MGGRAKIASIKNFILEDPATNGEDVMLLGKIDDHVFNLDLHYPLNPLIGAAIGLSSFLYKNW